MISRIYVEALPGTNPAADNLVEDIRTFLNIPAVNSVRIINRYDCENLTEEVFAQAITNVFAQLPVDRYFTDLEVPEDHVFAVSYLPGQFDQRADSAAVCIQMMAQVENHESVMPVYTLLTGK